MRVKKQRKIFCVGCSFLYYARHVERDGSSTNMLLCVATAEFINGPLRKRVDLKGVTSAENRNVNNDCGYRTPVSIRAWETKQWMTRSLDNGGQEKLKTYSIESENDKVKKLRESQKDRRGKRTKVNDESEAEEWADDPICAEANDDIEETDEWEDIYDEDDIFETGDETEEETETPGEET